MDRYVVVTPFGGHEVGTVVSGADVPPENTHFVVRQPVTETEAQALAALARAETEKAAADQRAADAAAAVQQAAAAAQET